MNDKYNIENLQRLCSESYSYAEVIKKLGNIPKGGNYSILKRYIKKYDIDISHFTHQQWHSSPNQLNNPNFHKGDEKWTDETLFVDNSYASHNALRKYVRRHEIFPYKCVNCGCDGNWMGGTISLELDHIDGNNMNNQLSNLRYLCPNCHALTDTYRGKNKPRNIPEQQKIERELERQKKKEIKEKEKAEKQLKRQKEIELQRQERKVKNKHTNREKLKEEIRKHSFEELGRQYGVSGKMVSKWCKTFRLPYKRKDINSISDEKWILV